MAKLGKQTAVILQHGNSKIAVRPNGSVLARTRTGWKLLYPTGIPADTRLRVFEEIGYRRVTK